MAWLPADRALTARRQLQELMSEFAYATCVAFTGAAAPGEQKRSGILFRAASHGAVPAEVLDRMEAILQLQGADVLRYTDHKSGQRRSMRMHRQGQDSLPEAILLSGDTCAQGWISGLLQDELPAQRYGRAMLLAVSSPPVPVASKGKVVRACFDVRDVAIQAQLKDCEGTDAQCLVALQGALRCGTNCGSSITELQRMVREAPATETSSSPAIAV